MRIIDAEETHIFWEADPADAGQIICKEYAWLPDGEIIRRWEDRSDRSVEYHVARVRRHAEDATHAYEAARAIRGRWRPVQFVPPREAR